MYNIIRCRAGIAVDDVIHHYAIGYIRVDEKPIGETYHHDKEQDIEFIVTDTGEKWLYDHITYHAWKLRHEHTIYDDASTLQLCIAKSADGEFHSFMLVNHVRKYNVTLPKDEDLMRIIYSNYRKHIGGKE